MAAELSKCSSISSSIYPCCLFLLFPLGYGLYRTQWTGGYAMRYTFVTTASRDCPQEHSENSLQFCDSRFLCRCHGSGMPHGSEGDHAGALEGVACYFYRGGSRRTEWCRYFMEMKRLRRRSNHNLVRRLAWNSHPTPPQSSCFSQETEHISV
jgi:hypothetical protein